MSDSQHHSILGGLLGGGDHGILAGLLSEQNIGMFKGMLTPEAIAKALYHLAQFIKTLEEKHAGQFMLRMEPRRPDYDTVNFQLYRFEYIDGVRKPMPFKTIDPYDVDALLKFFATDTNTDNGEQQ